MNREKRQQTTEKHSRQAQKENCTSKSSAPFKRTQSCKTRFMAAISRLDLATALLFAISVFTVSIMMLLMLLPGAQAIQDLLSLQGNADDAGSPINNGNLNVVIWDSAAGGNRVYNSTTDFNGAINDGKFDVVLGSGTNELSLVYGRIYYMDMEINGQNLEFNGSDRRMFQSSVGNITTLAIPAGNITGAKIAPNSIQDSHISIGAAINKSKISIDGNWSQLEIPSLTGTWTGTVNATRIVSASILNVSEAQSLQGFSAGDFLGNDSALNARIIAVNTSRAGIGACPTGQIVQNTTQTGVQCVPDQTAAGGGNPFNQELNTTSNVQFQNITAVNISAVNVSANSFFGSLSWSFLTNIPSYVQDWLTTIQAVNASSKAYSDTINSSRAGIASCPSGQMVQNTTNGGVQCVSPAGGGTVTNVDVNGSELVGGSITGIGSIALNVTQLNLYYMNLTDQKLNETALLIALNASLTAKIDANSTSFTSWIQSNNTDAIGRINAVNGSSASASLVTSLNASLTAKIDANSTQAQRDNSSQASLISTLRLDNTSQAGLISVLRTDNTTQGTEISVLRLDNASQGAELVNVMSGITNVVSNLSSLNSSLTAKIDANSTQAQRDNASQASLISVLQLDNISQASLISVLRTDNTTQGTEISVLRSDNASQGAELVNVRTGITNVVSNLTSLNTSLTAKIDANSTTFTSWIQSNSTALTTRIDANSTALMSTINQVNTSKANLTGMHPDLAVAYAENSSYLNGHNNSFYQNVSNIYAGILNMDFMDLMTVFKNVTNIFTRTNEFQNATYLATLEGNVGIGTTDTSQKLTVNGSVNISGNIVFDDSKGSIGSSNAKVNRTYIQEYIEFDRMPENPRVAPNGSVRFYGREIANKSFMSAIGPSGVNYILSTSAIDRRQAMVQSTGSSVSVVGDIATASGTASYIQVQEYGNLVNYVQTTVPGGVYGNAAWKREWFTFAFYRFRIASATMPITDTRLFVGFSSATAAVQGRSDNPAGQYVGLFFSNQSEQTEFMVVTENAAGIKMNYSTGVPVDNAMHEFKMWFPGNTTGYAQLDDMPVIALNTEELPNSNISMRSMAIINATGGAAKNIQIGRIYLEAEK